MTSRHDQPGDAAALRRRAEETLPGAASLEDLHSLSPEQTQQMLHDLHVHQIELEMQNEELRRSQAELDAARARYFDLYDLAPVGYLTISKPGLVLEANLTAATLLGVPRSALHHQRITSFILKDDQDIYYLHRKQLFETGEPQACELRMVRSDGTAFWAGLAASAAQNGGVNPVCRVVITDLTTRKRAEDETRSAGAFLDSIINAIADPVFVKDDHRRFVLVNDALCTIVGRPRADLLGEDGDDMFPEDQVAVFQKMDERVLSTGEENLNEESLSDLSSGKVRTIATRKTRYVDPAGKRFLVGVIRDLTERMRAEEQIKSQLAELQRWQDVMLGREDRVQELKREVNELCRRLGEDVRYGSQEEQ